MLTLRVPCTILVRSESASVQLRNLSEGFMADACDPLEYKCSRCGCEWGQEAGYNWRTAVCSNCYGERVIITVVRLGFENWGEHNGGAAEQRARYERAERQTKTAMAAIDKLRPDATRTDSVARDVEPQDGK